MELAKQSSPFTLPSFADTGLAEWLTKLERISENSKPAIMYGFLRKFMSRCQDYTRDFPFHCLLYDTCQEHHFHRPCSKSETRRFGNGTGRPSEQDAFQGDWLPQIQRRMFADANRTHRIRARPCPTRFSQWFPQSGGTSCRTA